MFFKEFFLLFQHGNTFTLRPCNLTSVDLLDRLIRRVCYQEKAQEEFEKQCPGGKVMTESFR